MEERLTAAGGELLATIRDRVATVTLNRPEALNALTLPMLEALAAWLGAWEDDERVRLVVLRGAGSKAFCAGGDVRALHANRDRPEANRRFMAVEYALDFRIHTYPKPVVAMIDGIVMGGGMGIAQGANVRIVGDGTRMAMPETAIGLFPDVGASWFLSRLPGALGIYIGLAGPTLHAADAIYCGLACAYVGPDAKAPLEESLREAAARADVFDAVRHLAPPSEPGMLPRGDLETHREAIDRHFARPTAAAIAESLRAERDPAHAPWARRALEALSRASPTMLEVAREQLRRGAGLALAECFRMELGMVFHAFEHGDLFEGVRARLVDKDQAPRWQPPTLAEVDRAAVEAFFEPRWSPEDHPLAHLGSERTP